MKISHSRYALHEIARYFKTNGWGGEAELLECLRDGLLVASIDYPTGWQSTCEIPTEFWVDLDLKNFDVLSRAGRDQGTFEYCIDGERFFDQFFEKLKSLAKAAVDHDLSEIPEQLGPIVLDRLELASFDGFDDWLNLVRVFHELAQGLDEDLANDLPVFVADNHWQKFRDLYGPADLAQKKTGPSGAPRNLYWPDLFGHLISLIVEKQGQDVLSLTGTKTWKELAGQLLRWAEQSIDFKSNTKLPDQDTLERKIKKFGKLN